MAELEKIKRERAEEVERQAREMNETEELDREEEIARGNPLLNLERAMGGGGGRGGSETPRGGGASSFEVKRRWDDGEFL